MAREELTGLERVAASEGRSVIGDWIVSALLCLGIVVSVISVNDASGTAAKAIDTPTPVELAQVTIDIVQ